LEQIFSLENAKKALKDNEMVLLYFSSEDCGICTSLLPKLDEMLENYPEINGYHISIDELQEASGEFSVFTVPTILLYIEGKEAVREARFISMDILEEKIYKYYNIFFK